MGVAAAIGVAVAVAIALTLLPAMLGLAETLGADYVELATT